MSAAGATAAALHLPNAAAGDGEAGTAQPFLQQLIECTRKRTLAYWRMPAYNLLRLLMTLACAIVSIVALFWSCTSRFKRLAAAAGTAVQMAIAWNLVSSISSRKKGYMP